LSHHEQKGSGQTRVKDGPDVCQLGNSQARHWRQSEELIAHLLETRLKFVLNVGDKSRCDYGEQTEQFSQKTEFTPQAGQMRKKALTMTKVSIPFLSKATVVSPASR